MRYFVDEEERRASHSSSYFEFQRGYYHDQCWLPDSISISDTLWDEFDLSVLFAQAIESFDYFGLTVVTKERWKEIVRLAKGSEVPRWQEVIAEAAPWVDECFKDHEVFTILGM